MVHVGVKGGAGAENVEYHRESQYYPEQSFDVFGLKLSDGAKSQSALFALEMLTHQMRQENQHEKDSAYQKQGGKQP